MKIQRQTELPRFAVGALAIAGASAANGATVQISFANNVVSSVGSGLNNFIADLTGDGLADVKGYPGTSSISVRNIEALWGNNNVLGFASDTSVRLGGRGFTTADTDRALVKFIFSDPEINNGSVTSGFLDMQASKNGDLSVQIHRLIFDDASTAAPTGLTSASTGIQEWSAVPEPSSLGLLALGAGGLLARRRRAA